MDARSQTGAITGMLKGITDASGTLCRDVDAETSALEAEVREITTNLGEMLRMLHDINSSFISLLENIERSVESLNTDLEAAATGIRVHQRTEIVLGKVIDELAGLVSQMRPMVHSSPVAASSANLVDLSGRYTMQSERKIHEGVARTNIPDAGKVFIPASHQDGVSGEYGDNVELF